MQSSVFLVGLGGIAVKYDLEYLSTFGTTHARAVENHKDFNLVGGFDPSEENRFEFSNYYMKKAYDDLECGLKETAPEVVVIASPTEKHLLNVEQILKWSAPRLILCEKPISLNPEDSNRMLDLCDERKIPLFVNYFRNSEPSTFEIANAISSNKMMKPFKGSCTYNKGSLHTATHFLNLFQIWFGEGAEYIFKSEKFNSHNPLDPNIEFEVKYEGGSIMFNVDNSTDSLIFHSTIEFSNGLLEYKEEGEEIIWNEASGSIQIQERDFITVEKFMTFPTRTQFNVWNEISGYLQAEKHRLCTAQEAIQYIIQISTLKRK